jgi:hypothetical protein
MNFGAMSYVTPFEAYTKYIAYRNHFTQDSYDIVKYNGKVVANQNSFETRKDKYFFHKLSKHKDVDGFLISHMLIGNPHKKWIRDMFIDEETHSYYAEWLKRKQSLTYIFQSDIELLDDDYNSNIFIPKDGSMPKLYKLILRQKISPETVIVLNTLSPFFAYWSVNNIDQFVWCDIRKKYEKYAPFVEFDRDKFRSILIQRFSHSNSSEEK